MIDLCPYGENPVIYAQFGSLDTLKYLNWTTGTAVTLVHGELCENELKVQPTMDGLLSTWSIGKESEKKVFY